MEFHLQLNPTFAPSPIYIKSSFYGDIWNSLQQTLNFSYTMVSAPSSSFNVPLQETGLVHFKTTTLHQFWTQLSFLEGNRCKMPQKASKIPQN